MGSRGSLHLLPGSVIMGLPDTHLWQKGGFPVADISSYPALSQLLDELAQYYQNYSAESTRQEAQASGLRQLGSWFIHSQRFSNDSMHTRFYEGVQKRVAQLVSTLDALDDPAPAAQAAARAIEIMVDPIPESQRDVGGWMRFAAEPLCQPLLTYLTREELQQLYDRYNRSYPKRLQFPAQVKLRKEMEKRLKRM